MPSRDRTISHIFMKVIKASLDYRDINMQTDRDKELITTILNFQP